MYILEVSSECAPFAKVGGLADVVFGLSRELAQRGNNVEIVVPGYDCIQKELFPDLHAVYNDLWVPWFNGHIHCTILFGQIQGRKVYLIDHTPRMDFSAGKKFTVVLTTSFVLHFFVKRHLISLKAKKRPDIIHCHDWQAGLLPVRSMKFTKTTACSISVHTLFTIQHQGSLEKIFYCDRS
jgi:starch synthase